MSLFTKLFYLSSSVNKPLENYFTEIVACFLHHNQDILIAWLKSYSIIIEDNYSNIKVLSQERYKNEKSIIDIQIDLSNGIDTDLIFIESKIDAEDPNNNLKKYAEILRNLPNIRHRILIYITRKDDRKDEIKVYTSNLSPKVSFYSLKWQDFYEFLNEHEADSLKPDTLKIEILKFMEKKEMSKNKEFSPIDLVSMINYRNFLKKTSNLMESTFSDEVNNKFQENFGKEKLIKPTLAKWKADGLYTISKEFPDWEFRYFLGYFDCTPEENSTEYPNIEHLKLGVAIGASAKYRMRSKFCLKSMDKVKDERDWRKRTNDEGWMTIDYTINIQELLSGKDHLSNIRNYFLESIDELKKIHDNYFSWNSLTTETTTEEYES